MITPRDQVRRNLTQTVIGRPLIDKIEAARDPETCYDVIIDPNLDFNGGRDKACERIRALIGNPAIRVDRAHPYIFATLTGRAIREIGANDSTDAAAQSDGEASQPAPAPGKQRLNSGARAIYRIWEDTVVEALLTNSIATVKADAAQAAFAADGKDIVWAVIDSGIDRRHQHFSRFCNLVLPAPLEHQDFTPDGNSPLTDEFGHGTHVAGIIAGMMEESKAPLAIIPTERRKRAMPSRTLCSRLAASIRGVAPQCRLLSLKVLNAEGTGKASAVIDAIAAIQILNDFGRRIVVHGVNLSLGYRFMPEWFACGQSPLCTEVNRLVKSGVVVVAAAGNSGYGSIGAMSGSVTSAGLALTINDPGNAENAITVGSTHRDMPHTYGVSYFSSKGPTGDGRMKPDLVAPGERIHLRCGGEEARARPATTSKTRDKHGCAPRFRRCCRVPFHSPRIHREAGGSEKNLYGKCDRPQTRPRLPGQRPCGSDAGDPSSMNYDL